MIVSRETNSLGSWLCLRRTHILWVWLTFNPRSAASFGKNSQRVWTLQSLFLMMGLTSDAIFFKVSSASFSCGRPLICSYSANSGSISLMMGSLKRSFVWPRRLLTSKGQTVQMFERRCCSFYYVRGGSFRACPRQQLDEGLPRMMNQDPADRIRSKCLDANVVVCDSRMIDHARRRSHISAHVAISDKDS